jgi:TPR repeat protein
LDYALQLHSQKRYREAWRIFKRRADEFGDPEAEYYVGFYLSTDDHDVEADHSLAIGYLQRAAEKGVSDAQFLYGIALLHGKGVRKSPENDALGVEHLRRAAERDNVHAALSYGGVILNGLYGLTQDIDQGVQWIRRAHAKRHPQAYPKLQSWLTNLKLPVPKDIQLAPAQTSHHQ